MKTPSRPQFPPSFASDESLQKDLQFLFEAEGFDTIYDEIEMEWQEALEGKLEPLKESVRLLVEVVLEDQKREHQESGDGQFVDSGSFEYHLFNSHNSASLAEKHRKEAFHLVYDRMPDMAYRHLLQAVQIDPFDVHIVRDMVRLLNDYPSFSSEDFLDVYRDILDSNQENREALYTMCRSFVELLWYLETFKKDEQYKDVLPVFAQLDVLFMRFWSCAEMLASGNIDVDDDQQVQNILDFAHLSFDLTDYDQALAKYKLVCTHNPENIEALFGVAEVYSKKDLPTEAFEWYQKVLDQDPNHAEARKKSKQLLKKTMYWYE